MLSMITGYFQSRPLRTKSQLRMTPVTGENLPARTRAEVWFEVFLLAGDPVGVAETAVHLESQVVVRAFLFEGIEFEGVFFGQFAECLVAGILIYIPERAWIESAAPPADVGRDEFSVGGRRSRKRLVGQPAFELFVLGRGYGEDAIGQFRHCLPGSASREKKGRQQCCAIGSGSHVRQ